MYYDESRKFKDEEIAIDLGQYHSVIGKFQCEIFPDTPPTDTNVNIEIKGICITWMDRHKLMLEISQVLKKYMI